ncbi:MAG: triose-phosphate isomerase [Candidatus Heimdallarchaeota archaeon]|nr:triose-phosphate isomerase [Candidatus Heimdallarchaeota archaeon]
MRTPIIAGNWKLNKNIEETISYLENFNPAVKNINDIEIIICPPHTSLSAARTHLDNTTIIIGSQNMYHEPKGNFTGEISASMIKELCTHVIIGHSERRNLFSETDEMVNKKVKTAIDHDLIPIICYGEKLEEKEAGLTAAIISKQVRKSLSGIRAISGNQLILAYEPVWAIGSGQSASPSETNILIRNVIRPTVSGLFGSSTSEKMRVLYGGSVNEKNIESFLTESEIDGALIGGASLKHAVFSNIIKIVEKYYNS